MNMILYERKCDIMSVTVMREEYIGEQDGFMISKFYTSDGGVTLSKTPILEAEEYNKRKRTAVEVLSEIECRRMARAARRNPSVTA